MKSAQWMKWAATEGLTKTGNSLINKLIGLSSTSLFSTVLVNLVASFIQFTGGLIGAKRSQVSLKITGPQLLGCMIFGFFASLSSWTLLSIYTHPGSEVGVTTFIVSLSIVPSTLVAWLLFSERLNWRQWLGVICFIGAGYAVLNFPSLSVILSLPTWIFMAMGLSLLVGANEVITQIQARVKLKPLNPWVNNFWVGLTSTVLSGAAAIYFGKSLTRLAEIPARQWVGSVAIGLLVILMIQSKLLSYQRGGTMATKRLVMSGTYIIGTLILGFLIYREPITVGKVIGVLGFFLAFILTDEGTWRIVTRFKPKQN